MAIASISLSCHTYKVSIGKFFKVVITAKVVSWHFNLKLSSHLHVSLRMLLILTEEHGLDLLLQWMLNIYSSFAVSGTKGTSVDETPNRGTITVIRFVLKCFSSSHSRISITSFHFFLMKLEHANNTGKTDRISKKRTKIKNEVDTIPRMTLDFRVFCFANFSHQLAVVVGVVDDGYGNSHQSMCSSLIS